MFRAYDSSIGSSHEFLSALVAAGKLAEEAILEKKPAKYSTTYICPLGSGENKTTIVFKFFPVVGKKSGIAIDFTPSKLNANDWMLFRHMLSFVFKGSSALVVKKFKISRLEIALDVKAAFDEMVCIAPGVAIENLKYLPNGTRYLGQKGGKRTFCIYDKRKQLADKAAVDLGENRTRIEVRLRRLGKVLSDLTSVTDPFGGLLIVRKPLLAMLCNKYPNDLLLKTFAQSVASGISGQAAYTVLLKHQKKQLIDRLRESAIHLNGKSGAWENWIEPRLDSIRANFTE